MILSALISDPAGAPVLSNLIGLARACLSNTKDEKVDQLILRCLHVLENGISETDSKDLVREILDEKFRISPGCAVCASPCGNTSAYELNRILDEDPAVQKIKHELFSCAVILADRISAGQAVSDDILYLYQVLYLLAEEWDASDYQSFVEQGRQLAQ